MSHILTALICLLIGWRVGWEGAHHTVAKECDRLGAFFVGKTVYHCVRKTEVEP